MAATQLKRQDVLWIPKGLECEGYITKRIAPVPYSGPKPTRVWSLYLETDPTRPPTLPFAPVHHQNAFLEDYVHDWDIRGGNFIYASRVTEGGIWLLLEFLETQK